MEEEKREARRHGGDQDGPIAELLLAREGWIWKRVKIRGIDLEMLVPGEAGEGSTPRSEPSIQVQPAPTKLWDYLFRAVRRPGDAQILMYIASRAREKTQLLRAAVGDDVGVDIDTKLDKVRKRLKAAQIEGASLFLCGSGGEEDLASCIRDLQTVCSDPCPPVTWRMWGEYGALMACMAQADNDPVTCFQCAGKPTEQLKALVALEADIFTGRGNIEKSTPSSPGYSKLHLRWRYGYSLSALEKHLTERWLATEEVLRPWCARMCGEYGLLEHGGCDWVAVWVRYVPGEGHGLAKNMTIDLLEDIIEAVGLLARGLERRLGLLLFGDKDGVSVGKFLKPGEEHESKNSTIPELIATIAPQLEVVDFRGLQSFSHLREGCMPPVIVGRTALFPVDEVLGACKAAGKSAYLLQYNQMLFYRYLQAEHRLLCAVGAEAGNLDNFAYSGVPVISVDIRDPVDCLEQSTITDRIGQYSLLSHRWVLLNGLAGRGERIEFKRYLLGALFSYISNLSLKPSTATRPGDEVEGEKEKGEKDKGEKEKY